MTRRLIAVVLLVLATVSTSGQTPTFSSGSTGADGALDLSTCLNSTCIFQLSESGVMNYTTVNVPAGKTLIFRPNWNNTPVTILATGTVTVAGNIYLQTGWDWIHYPTSLTGAAVWPGPGGFSGGAVNTPGMGPGGGTSTVPGGKWIGPLSLVPIIGGSGGAGGAGGCSGTGGGGGGAIVIASSTSITVTGLINADGHLSSCGGTFTSGNGAGSGGAIRLVSNSISVPTGGVLYARGAGPGLIRLEAPAGAMDFRGTSDPVAIMPNTINAQVLPTASASLRITKIGGYDVPPSAGRRLDTADLVLPRSLVDPINVVVTGSLIPVGTTVNLVVSPATGITSTTAALAGTLQASSATLTLTGASRTAITYFFVSATFDVPAGSSGDQRPGADQVARVRVDAEPGKPAKFVFLRANGTEVDPSKVPASLRAVYQHRP